VRSGLEQFQCVGGDTLHKVRCEGGDEQQILGGGQSVRFLARFLEIRAVLDQFGAEGGHRGVLFGAVAERDDDGDGQAEPAAGPGQGLAMIAAGGGN